MGAVSRASSCSAKSSRLTSTGGDDLVQLLRAAERDVLLVAPYIKARTLERLLEACAGSVALRVVTRWRLDEIAAGVSDLDVWPMLNARGAQLWLHPNLHAKYYRADDRCVVGSANLTAAGLGWKSDANLEILVEATEHNAALSTFEPRLWPACRRVDEALYRRFLVDAEAFLAASPLAPQRPDLPEAGSLDFETWKPRLRFPEDLFRLYGGRKDDLTSAAQESAVVDLMALDPPTGLNEIQFRTWVGNRLTLHPEMEAIDRLSETSRRFGEMRDLLEFRGSEDPNRDWQTWMRWIDHFMPSRYRMKVANHSEIFMRTAASE
ncbi:MAG: hypothetical protein EON59_11630 [Alphaproteobacteria bacterium]|nr:MAG: hypothetical protein EON59_11630 [Alphaproteobacteria bacterium]